MGLKTAIWNNEIKSALLLAGFPFLLLGMLWSGAALYYMGHPDAADRTLGFLAQYGYLAFMAAGGWFVIAFFFHQAMIDRASGARPVSRSEEPQLYNLLENLCISRGLPVPKLALIDTPQLNAFASGLSDKNYTVTLTTGIIQALEPHELEAVIAHELTHIRNHDVRLLIISVIFVGMISFLAEMAFRSMTYGRSSRGDRRDGRMLLIAMLVLAVGYLFAILIRFALSRKREYLADAGAVELTKRPESMISALEKISGRAHLEGMPAEVAQMCIENDSRMSLFGLFATHPSIEDRIAVLREYGGISEPELAASEKGPWG